MIFLVMGGPRSCVPRVFDDSSDERRVEDPSQDQCQVGLLVREYGCCGPDQKGGGRSSEYEDEVPHLLAADLVPRDEGGDATAGGSAHESADASGSEPEWDAHHAVPQYRPTPIDSGGLWAALCGDDRGAIRIGCLSREDIVIIKEDSVL